MKDYFDLCILLSEGSLELLALRRAVEATFAHRQLPVPADVPSGLSDSFARDAVKRAQWTAFLKKNRLDALDLIEVVSLLRNEYQKLQTQG